MMQLSLSVQTRDVYSVVSILCIVSSGLFYRCNILSQFSNNDKINNVDSLHITGQQMTTVAIP